MSNEILWLLVIVVSISLVLFTYRFLGKAGLVSLVSVSVILANLQVSKIVTLFGLTSSLGNIVYGATFLATDILTENHGRKVSRQAIMIGFVFMVAFTILMELSLLFVPSSEDTAHASMVVLYSSLPRIVIGSMVAYLVSQYHDVFVYQRLKDLKPGTKWIWLRSTVSTLLSQAIDTVLFTIIAFLGRVSFSAILQIGLTAFVLKWGVTLFNTPAVYLAAFWSKKGVIEDN